jgi:hypothetical protein
MSCAAEVRKRYYTSRTCVRASRTKCNRAGQPTLGFEGAQPLVGGAGGLALLPRVRGRAAHVHSVN